MITFRYADNLLGGHGLVFNVGDRVQGYTHPLWLLLILPGLALSDDPVYVSVLYGVVLTLLFGWVVAGAVLSVAGERLVALWTLSLLAAVLVTSEAWRSFQTSGLENSLTGLLIALIAVDLWRPRVSDLRLAGFSVLLVLARPDLGFLVLPMAVVVAEQTFERQDWRSLARLAMAALPLLAWALFAQLYYGQLEPNTADAKLGIYASVWESSGQGLDYLSDWLKYEPVAVVAAVAFVCIGLVGARDWRQRGFLLGLVTYVAYVVFIGGDFMRGRLLLPSFTGACVFGALAFVRWRPATRDPGFMALTTALVVVLGVLVSPHQDGGINDKGIANERLAYSGYSLTKYIENGGLTGRGIDLDFAVSLARYAAACGPVTIHHANPGSLGYLAGPEVTLIDTMGLTDEVIAALPRSEQVDAHPRPGHPAKRMPVSYLARRGDISLFAGWPEAIEQLDCTYQDYPRLFVDSTDTVLPNVVFLVVLN